VLAFGWTVTLRERDVKMWSFPNHPDDKPVKTVNHSFVLSVSFNLAYVVVIDT